MENEQTYTEEDVVSMLEQQKDWSQAEPEKKDSIFKFFKYLIGLEDTSKTGNVSKDELGKPLMPIRGVQKIALYANEEGLERVGKYLMATGETDLATSGSLRGFNAQNFVTQIQKRQVIKGASEKKGWFDKKIRPEEKTGGEE